MTPLEFQTYARKTIRQYADGILKEIPAVKASQTIEPLHRMRVSSRRLRVALSIFKNIFPKDRSEEWLGNLRTLGRELGRGREIDIQILFIQGQILNTADKSIKSGLTKILNLYKEMRCAEHQRILEAISLIQQNRTLEDLIDQIDQCLNDPQRLKDSFTLHARQRIAKRLKELLTYERFAAFPEKNDELHLLRVAAKKLRYALEIFDPLFDEAFRPFSFQVKKIQDILGNLHEFDVWAKSLPEIASAHGQEDHLRDACEHLKKQCERLREQSYKDFFDLWGKMKKEELWSKLQKLLKE